MENGAGKMSPDQKRAYNNSGIIPGEKGLKSK